MSDALIRWPTKRLRYLADFNPPVPAEVRRSDAEFPLFSMDAIHQFGRLSVPEMRPASDLLGGYSYVEPTDVAYAKVTPCFENGKGLIGTDLDGPSFATTELTVLRPRHDVSQRFLAYALQASICRSRAIASMTGAGGLKRVSESSMRNIQVPAPDRVSQRTITDYLDHETAEIDLLAAELERMSVLSIEEYRTRWDDELDIIYATTEVRKLKRCVSIPLSYGANLPADQAVAGDIRYLRITDFTMDGSIRRSTRRTLPLHLAIDHLVDAGDILIARSGATVGKSFLVPDHKERSCYAGYLIRARPSEIFDPAFLHATLNSTRFWHWVDANKTIATIPNINAERYGQYVIPVPTPQEQRDTVARLRGRQFVHKKILRDLDHAITLAKERRAALITAAVTGQIDVNAKRRPAAEQLEDDIKELS